MQVEVRVDSRIRVRTRDLPEGAGEELRAKFTYENPEYKRRERAGLDVGDEPEIIRTWRFEGEDTTLPRGGIGRVRAVLEKHGLSRRVVDARCNGDLTLLRDFGPIPRYRREPWTFQARSVEEALARENHIVRAPTGSGKTSTGLMFISAAALPALVVVNTVGLLEQWARRVLAELGCEPGIVGDGKHRVRPVTVSIRDTITHMRPLDRGRFLERFGTIVADELQGYAAPTVYECIDPVPARYRLGLSADETRHDHKEFLIYDLFGDTVTEIPVEEVRAAGKVLDVEVRVVPTDFAVGDWYMHAILGDNKFQRMRARHKLAEEMQDDPGRNAVIRQLVQQIHDEGEPALVLIERRDHAINLDHEFVGMGLKSGKVLGSKKSKAEYGRSLSRIAAGNLDVAVGTVKAVGTGIDLPSIARAVIAQPIAGNKQLLGQVKGRICRASEGTGKVDAVAYYLWDHRVFGRRALENIVRCTESVIVREADGSWTDGRHYLRAMKSKKNLPDVQEAI